MAIVQISRITQRKGLGSDLPQPLAGAELGWATDQRRLFIGNGSLADGAPTVGNTEVLTEFSDILSFATQYTYEGAAAGYTAQTGDTPGNSVAQSIQRRLDSYAVITDFGATGDGVTDVTKNINSALFQIFCRSASPSARRSIFFPAGVYVITDTLKIPPNCQLYGEGADSTIISFNVLPLAENLDFPGKNVIQYEPGTLISYDGSFYRSKILVPIDTATAPGIFWQQETLPEYIFRTADNLQQIGNAIDFLDSSRPGNIEILSMKFLTNQVHNGILIEKAARCVFDSVTVEGPLTQSDLGVVSDDTAAVRWISNSSNVTWNNCKFSGFTYATSTQEEIQGVTFSNCEFDTLHQGIVLGGAAPVNGGPTGVRVVQNIFDNIHSEGIVIDGVNNNATAYNTFYDVGNGFNGSTFPATSIIVIDADNNVSIGDMFERNTVQSAIHSRISLVGTNSIALGMNITGITFFQDNAQDNTLANQLMLGQYQRTSGIRDEVTESSSPINLAIVNTNILKIPAFKVDYTIVRNNFYRTGTIAVVSGQSGTAGTGFSYSDDYVENGDTGVTMVAAQNGTESAPLVVISYTSTGQGDGIIRYSISHLS